MKKLILSEKQEKLLDFVKEQHGDQKRKYTGEPYWTHPYAVAKIVSECTQYNYPIEIALCHDLFEDTKCTHDDLRTALLNFGYSKIDSVYIVAHIHELTDIYTKEFFPQMNREERKREEAERLGKISAVSQSVKYADLIDNTSSIADYDPGFAKVYLEEKKELLNQMRGGDINLYIKACHSYQTAINKLEDGKILHPGN